MGEIDFNIHYIGTPYHDDTRLHNDVSDDMEALVDEFARFNIEDAKFKITQERNGIQLEYNEGVEWKIVDRTDATNRILAIAEVIYQKAHRTPQYRPPSPPSTLSTTTYMLDRDRDRTPPRSPDLTYSEPLQQMQMAASELQSARSIPHIDGALDVLRARVDQLEREKAGSADELAAAIAEKERALTAMLHLERDKSDLEGDLASAKQQVEYLKKQTKTIRASQEASEKEAEGLRTQLRETRGERDKLAGDLDSAKNAREAAESKIRMQSTTISSLQDDVDGLKDDLQSVQDQSTKDTAEIERLNKEIAGKSRALRAAIADKEEATEVAASQQRQVKTLTAQMQEQEDELERLRAALRAAEQSPPPTPDKNTKKVARLEAQIKKLESTIDEQESRIKQEVDTSKKLRTKLRTVRQEQGTAEETSEKLTIQLRRLQVEFDDVTAELAQEKEKVATHERRTSLQASEIHALTGELKDVRGQLDDAEKRAQASDAQVRIAQDRAGTLQKELSAVRRERDTFAADLEEAIKKQKILDSASDEENKEAAEKISKTERAQAESESKFKELTKEHEKTQSALNILQGRNAALEREQGILQKQYDSLQGKHKELQQQSRATDAGKADKIATLEQQLATEKRALEALQKRATELEKTAGKLPGLQRELEESGKAREALRNEHEALQRTHQELTQRLKRSGTTNASLEDQLRVNQTNLATSEKSLAAAEMREGELQKKIGDLETRNSALAKEKEELEKTAGELPALRGHLRASEESLKKLRVEHEQLQREKEAVEQRAAASGNAIAELERNLHAKQAEVDARSQDLARASESHRELQAHIAELERRNRALLETAEEKMGEVTALRKEQLPLQRRIEQLEKETQLQAKQTMQMVATHAKRLADVSQTIARMKEGGSVTRDTVLQELGAASRELAKMEERSSDEAKERKAVLEARVFALLGSELPPDELREALGKKETEQAMLRLAEKIGEEADLISDQLFEMSDLSKQVTQTSAGDLWIEAKEKQATAEFELQVEKEETAALEQQNEDLRRKNEELEQKLREARDRVRPISREWTELLTLLGHYTQTDLTKESRDSILGIVQRHHDQLITAVGKLSKNRVADLQMIDELQKRINSAERLFARMEGRAERENVEALDAAVAEVEDFGIAEMFGGPVDE